MCLNYRTKYRPKNDEPRRLLPAASIPAKPISISNNVLGSGTVREVSNAPRTERMELLLWRLWRAMRVVGRLHLPQFEYAVEHSNHHGNNQKPHKSPLHAVCALAV